MTEENPFTSHALPADIKEYIKLYCATKDESNPIKGEAQEAIDSFKERIEVFEKGTTDRFFIEEYWTTVIASGDRILERKKKYAEEKEIVLDERRTELEKLKSEKEDAIKEANSDKNTAENAYTWLLPRIVPVIASYKGLSAILANAEIVSAVTLGIIGLTEVVVRKLSKTKEEKTKAKYDSKIHETNSRFNSQLQNIEDWFSHDKGVIYQEAEEKAQNTYEVCYGKKSPFPSPKPGPIPAPKLYVAKEKSSIWKTLGLAK